MRFALINPNWSFDGSVYFGCREPHLPLEYGYAAAVLRREGHDVLMVDAHLFALSDEETRARVKAFGADVLVVTTAPSYLFWRCPPPELRTPALLLKSLRNLPALQVAVGPHGSVAPRSVLRKLGVDAVVMGEFEDILPHFSLPDWREIPSIAYRAGEELRVQGEPAIARLFDLPPLEWPPEWIGRHRHQHHRFDAPPLGPGAEMETSRGCPYRCTFCAKESFRGIYRKRPLPVVLREFDALLAHGVEYVYFIDEIFLPDIDLLHALAERRAGFGIQTRIDLWSPEMLSLLGKAGCRSIEAGVESLTEEGRRALGKPGRLTTQEITSRLALAKTHVPFVQANLIAAGDHPRAVALWREELRRQGVWANDPVPLFPYPGSEAYRNLFGPPDDLAWERAHSWYLSRNERLSDLQEHHPLPLAELELCGGPHG